MHVHVHVTVYPAMAIICLQADNSIRLNVEIGAPNHAWWIG